MNDLDISTDGVTVWVHDHTGYCIGRFGRMGIDIHRLPTDKGECLFCTHAAVTADDWVVFQQQMKLLHDVEVADSFTPRRFRG